jgi:hypothetical protein
MNNDQDALFWVSRAARRNTDTAAVKLVLRELLEASEQIGHARIPMELREARLTLAQNAARNVLKDPQ